MQLLIRAARIRARIHAVAAVAALTAACVCGAPAAATQVYHSPNDDGQPPVGTPALPVGGAQPVYLYIDGGAVASAAGSACDTGAGDEVCGYTLALTGLSGLTFAGFTPDAGADVLYDLGALELRINGLDTAAPTPGPKRIGELLVDAAAGGSLELSSGEVVGADLSSETLPVETLVAVPEPGFWLQLASGAALLAWLGRGRARA